MQQIQIQSLQKRKLIAKGFKALSVREFDKAAHYFGEVLRLDSSDKQARIGVLIADIAQDFPKKAELFTELYQILLASSPRSQRENIQNQMLDILREFDESLGYISQLTEKEESLESEQLNGIAYKDFVALCEKQGFKEVFENLIFSSKIIFTQRSDFYQFLKDLIEHGFKHIALAYIEDMPQIAYNSELQDMLKDTLKEDNKN